ncbi:DUF4369 domain-containing protein [Robiginitalea sp.]|uniref:DUF4369 domain-containing protein n=1 Tax=Robiginitalea sp. TaxID=1902411 RepID=UPI003C7108A9
MKSFIYSLTLLLLFVSCQTEDESLKMVVAGNVKGLKKGTLFLQAIPDSALVNLDSVEIRGDGNFEFITHVPEPDVFYLYLDNDDNNSLNDRIAFFGEAGTYQIMTRWDAFETDAIVSGTENQKKYEEFKENMSRFNLRQLELSRALRSSQITQDSIAVDSIELALDQSLRRKYLYTLNFAHTHKGSELAPYVAWAEIADANPKLLDSLYKTLPADIADSKYGKKLKGILDSQQ